LRVFIKSKLCQAEVSSYPDVSIYNQDNSKRRRLNRSLLNIDKDIKSLEDFGAWQVAGASTRARASGSRVRRCAMKG